MQAAFIQHDRFQCGYCTSGQILSAVGCVTGAMPAPARDPRIHVGKPLPLRGLQGPCRSCGQGPRRHYKVGGGNLMRPSGYQRPLSPEDAVGQVAPMGPAGQLGAFLAGGTMVVDLMKLLVVAPPSLTEIGALAMTRLRIGGAAPCMSAPASPGPRRPNTRPSATVRRSCRTFCGERSARNGPTVRGAADRLDGRAQDSQRAEPARGVRRGLVSHRTRHRRPSEPGARRSPDARQQDPAGAGGRADRAAGQPAEARPDPLQEGPDRPAPDALASARDSCSRRSSRIVSK